MRKFTVFSFLGASLMTTALAAAPVATSVTCKQVVNPEKLSSFIPKGEVKADAPILSRYLAAEAADNDLDIITETPEGTREVYSRSGEGWYVELINAQRVKFDHHGGELIKAEDGSVYMKNPASHFCSNSWIVGYEEEGKLKFEFPQPIFTGINWIGQEYEYYAVMLDYVAQSAQTGTYVTAEDQILSFTKQDDGSYVQDGPNDGSKLFGLVTQDGDWFGYGDWGLKFTPFTTEPVKAPEGLETEKWAMKYSAEGHFVEVGIDGQDMWVKGLSTILPDAWVKGTIKGARVVFDSGQYVGMDDTDYYHNWFFGSSLLKQTNPDTGKLYYTFYLSKDLKMDYDEESKSLSTDAYILFNAALTEENAHDYYVTPEIAWQPEEVSPYPAKIEVLDFFPYDAEEEAGGILFVYTQYNTKGQLLDPSRLYYRILIDDDYLTVDPYDYQKVEQEMVDIPYYYIDYDLIFGRQPRHEFYFVVRDMDYLGIRPVYIAEDGKKYLGAISSMIGSPSDVWDEEENPELPNEEGIESVNADLNAVSEAYFTLQGVKTDKPEKGLYLRTVKYDDGSTRTFKVMK